MELIDFVKCPTKLRSPTNCCTAEAAMGSDVENSDHNDESFVLARWKGEGKDDRSDFVSEPMIPFVNIGRSDSSVKDPSCRSSNQTNLMYPVGNRSNDRTELDYCSESEKGELRCPRCGKKMQEPRVLPCLHPICTPCVYELMSRRDENRSVLTRDVDERCPLCDFRLSNVSCSIPATPLPPPHYPLQHRLVMDAIRCKLAHRILCDACSDEVLALVQCAACLRNFCSECSTEHVRQTAMDARPVKHLVRPLWEATRVRRTALCQIHPSHALRFYCIACQQVTCKECMWSSRHRGHASENAIGAGKRAATYLGMMLQQSRTLLNCLLTRYSDDVFSNPCCENQATNHLADYRISSSR